MAKKQKTAKRTANKVSHRAAMSVATNVDKTAKQRVAAIASAPLAVIESDKDLEAMLTVLSNTDEPIAVRLAAFQALQAAAFSVLAFASNRGDYIATLRKVATDPDPESIQLNWRSRYDTVAPAGAENMTTGGRGWQRRWTLGRY